MYDHYAILLYKFYLPEKLIAVNSLKACAQRFRYALFAFIHTQTYFEYYTLTLCLASLVKRAVIYAYWTKELLDICRENASHMATLPSVARHVIHADNLGPHQVCRPAAKTSGKKTTRHKFLLG